MADGFVTPVKVVEGTIDATVTSNILLDDVVAQSTPAIQVRAITGLDIKRGLYSDMFEIDKFGRGNFQSGVYTPVTGNGIYRTPQKGSETQLRVKAGDANDAPGGTGARSVYIEGVDANGNTISEVIATNGAAAGPNSVQSFLRLYRMYVATSGTYATQAAGSAAAAITIENAAGTEDWGYMDGSVFPFSQSTIGCYTIAANRTGFIDDITFSVEGVKTASLVLFQRTNILQTSAPYDAMRIVQVFEGLSGFHTYTGESPLGPFVGPCDIGYMVKPAANNTLVSVDFHITQVTT